MEELEKVIEVDVLQAIRYGKGTMEIDGGDMHAAAVISHAIAKAVMSWHKVRVEEMNQKRILREINSLRESEENRDPGRGRIFPYQSLGEIECGEDNRQ